MAGIVFPGLPSMRLVLLLACAVGLNACTFVHMAPSAKQVRVLGSAPGCEKRGEVSVSVQDKVGFYARSESQVRDELETLARNEAPGVGADSISPLTPPRDAEQRWPMWRCG